MSTNNCTLSVKVKEKLVEEINKRVGSNETLRTGVLSLILDSNNDTLLSNSFVNHIKNNYSEEEIGNLDFENLNGRNMPKIARYAVEYYKKVFNSVSTTAKDGARDAKTTTYGYTSVSAREEGKEHIAIFMLDTLNYLQNNNLEVPKDAYNYFKNEVRKRYLNFVFQNIAEKNNKSIALVRQEYEDAETKGTWIIESLGGVGFSVTTDNIIALYKELFSQTGTDEYIREIFGSTKVADVYARVKNEIIDTAQQETADENTAAQDGQGEVIISTNDLNMDDSFSKFENRIGIYTSFMTHIGARAKNYFNTLRRIKSHNLNDYATENYFGFPETMDANECCSIIYNRGDFTNVSTMIASIEKIAQNIPGFESFIKLAQDLKDNLDFATEMFTTFSKTKMRRIETMLQNGEVNTHRTNTKADARMSLFYDVLNDLDSSLLADDDSTILKYCEQIKQKVSDIKNKIAKNKITQDEINSSILVAKSLLVKAIRQYMPTIDSKAITTFIDLNNEQKGNEGKLENLIDLNYKIEVIAEKAKAIKREYNEDLAKIEAIEKVIQEAKDDNKWLSYEQLHAADELRNKSYTDAITSNVLEIIDKLLPHSVVNTQFNSRNIYGNNTSDIINSSWVTRFNELLSRTTIETINGQKVARNKELEKWGTRKLRSSQYKYSNILLEERNTIGDVVKRGLFRYIDDGSGHQILTVTEYAGELLKIGLMNGSANRDASKYVSYEDMTRPDFVPTSFMQFFNTIDKPATSVLGVNPDINIATYFMRTPSDASNIFTVQGPRYSTRGLINLENVEEIDEATTKLALADITKYAPEGSNVIDLSNYANPLEGGGFKLAETRGTISEYAKPSKSLLINNVEAINYIDDKKTQGYVTFYDEETGYIIVRRGNIIKSGKATLLSSSELIGVAGIRFYVAENADGTKIKKPSKITEIPRAILDPYKNYYYNELKQGRIKGQPKFNYTVFRNHNVYKMLKNQFKQEMLNAATAIAHYFDLAREKDGTYTVKRIDGKPAFLANKRKNNVGYKFYHLGEDGTVYKEVKDELGNTWIVLDGGSVFRSGKFTLSRTITDNEGNSEVRKENYFEDLIKEDVPTEVDDSVINLLYGRGIRFIVQENGRKGIVRDDKTGDPKVVDVVFEEALDRKIDERLDKFILDCVERNTDILANYEDFLNKEDYTEENITEFALNQFLMFCNYDELFEGNTKFYKDSQTVLKRAKEYEASGVPYGISDLLFSHEDNLSDVSQYSFLNQGYIVEPEMEEYTDAKGKTKLRQAKNEDGSLKWKRQTIQGDEGLFHNTIFEGTTQRNGFRAVTIKNSIKTDRKVLDRLVKKLVDDCKMTEEAAQTLLYGPIVYKDGKPVEDKENGGYKRKGGFTDSKVNDAQSYITVQEWVRRIAARGQLQRNLPLIKKLCDPNVVLTASELKQFVQVQKNIYYDLYYDSRYGIEVPRQIKNAEFVLVPQLIKGTELEKVYNLMRKHGIDQLNTVETSKASNEELLSLWDNNGDLTEKNIEEFERRLDSDDSPAMIYSYNNLYTQQETPQHMNAENKAGIQIVKKLMDNLPNDDKRKVKFFELFSANIQESFENTMKQFEIPLDENGNIALDEEGHIKGLNKKVFYDKLREEMVRTGMDSNLADYVTIPEDGDQPLMPTGMNNVITKFEQVVQSMFNNAITRQKLPGFHAPQVTNIGWNNMSETLPKYTKKALENSRMFKEFSSKTEDDKIKWTSEEDNATLTKETQDLFRDYINTNSPTYSKKLKYHPYNEKTGKTESYIEVMVPLSYLGIDRNSKHYKGMTDEQILEELEKEGLDTFIGYRIPTEGKQSVCIMKVAGILSDAYGSTIVVPDEWVAQTGSDFDVDSIYTIQYETYKNHRTGEITKIHYKDGKKEKLDANDYLTYISSILKELNHKDKSDERKKLEGEIKELVTSDFKELMKEEHKLYESLPKNIQTIIKGVNAAITLKYAEIEEEEPTGKEIFIERLEDTLSSINNRLKTVGKALESAKKIGDEKIIKDVETDFNHLTRYKTTLENILNNIKNGKREELAKKLSSKAKEAGFMSYEEFIDEKNIVRANSREARNSGILDAMIDILKDDIALEENLSRSNFDDITYWRNILMSDNFKNEREARSAYDWYDQAMYQEDAMSGAKLKAASVTMDTFCSVCNTVKPRLATPIRIVYNSDTVDNADDIKKRYDVKGDGKYFVVEHDQYGWSTDNKNIAGRILTAYSSQTTAYILDAIKEGSLPNVNMYTFNVFKLFPNLGCDYRTALSFIMQPAITRIVTNNNNNASIFSNYHENPIDKAIRDIAAQLGITDVRRSTPIPTVLKMINDNQLYHDRFNEFFSIDDDGKQGEDINISLKTNLPIDVDLLVNRIKEDGDFEVSSPVEDMDEDSRRTRNIINEDHRISKLIFDLGVVLTFSRLHSVAYNIGNIARCCNPDKFGAKQTVYATRKVFDDINEAMFNTITIINEEDEEITNRKNRKPVLTVDDKHILAAIYPGLDNSDLSPTEVVNAFATSDAKNSSYKTLFNFLKYSTATSVIIARTLFETEHENFTRLVEGFKYVLNGYKNNLTDEQYTDIKKYILSSMYTSVPSIKYPVRVKYSRDKQGNITTNGIEIIPYKDEDQAKKMAADERERVYGFNRKPNLSINKIVGKKLDENGNEVEIPGIVIFDTKDVDKPTDEEIEDFSKLTPAQKIKFIKSNFHDAGIFNYITPSLFNNASRGTKAGMQTIEYIADNIDANTAYSLFKEAMFNDNPLIVLTAIDLIKYGIFVEGLRMSQRAVNKVIDNDAFINTLDEGGLNFVNEIRAMFNQGTTQGVDIKDFNIRSVYENYLRSHPETKGIRTIWINSKNREKYKLDDRAFGIYCLTTDTTIEDAGERAEEFNARLDSMGVRYKLPGKDAGYAYNEYIRLQQDNINRLYRIVTQPNTFGMILMYPLGELMENEIGYASTNKEYNKGLDGKTILDSEGYDIVCSEIFRRGSEFTFTPANVAEIVNQYAPSHWLSNATVAKFTDAIPFNIDAEIAEDNNGMAIAKDEIVKWFSNINTKERPLFIRSSALQKFIHTEGEKKGSLQTIEINGIRKKFNISLMPKRKVFAEAFLTGEEDVEMLRDNSSLYNIVKSAKNNKERTIWNLFKVVPVEDANNENMQDEDVAYAATLEETSSKQISFAVSQRGTYNEQNSIELLEKFRIREINEDVSVIGGKLDYVTRELAAYATNMANYIKTELFDKFYKIPGEGEEFDTYISITDPRIQELIKNDANLQNKYLNALNTAGGFIKVFSESEVATYESSDATIAHRIEDIKKAVEKVKALPVDKLNTDFIRTVASKMSTNPLLKEDFIDVCDSYWRTETMWRFTDIMDNGTPLIQIMMKDVMSDLDAKRKHNSRVLRAFWDKVNDIRKRAREHGVNIDMNKIVDEHGRFNRAYSSKFIDKLDELRQKKDDEAIKDLGGIEHLKAKLEYDIFKGKHINQPAKQEYYIWKARLESFMLNGGHFALEELIPDENEREAARRLDQHDVHSDTGFPELFSYYTKLTYEMLDIYSHQSVDGLTPDDEKRLQEIREEILNLRGMKPYDGDKRSHYSWKGQVYEREHYDPEKNYTADELERIKLFSFEAREAINFYCNSIDELNKKYFNSDEAFGFREELRRNLDIVIAAEDRDAQGVIQRSELTLRNDSKYVEAKEWLRKNAKFVMHFEGNSATSLSSKLLKAVAWLSYGRNGKSSTVNDIMRNYKDENDNPIDIFDELGAPDGRKLSDEAKEKIKNAQESKFGTQSLPPFSDKRLISNAPDDRTPDLKAEFYVGMSGGSEKSAEYYRIVTEINNITAHLYNSQTKIINLSAIPDTEEGIELINNLADLYQQLRELGHGNRRFIEKNVVFKTNNELLTQQVNECSGKSNEYKQAMLRVLVDFDKDGNPQYQYDENGVAILNPNGTKKYAGNRYLFSYAVPKGQPGTEQYDKWLAPSYDGNDYSMNGRIAMDTINQCYRTRPTIYYELEKARIIKECQLMMEADGDTERSQQYYEDWYTANHVYNPYNRRMEPIACWTKTELRTEQFEGNELEGRWEPKGKQIERKVKDGWIRRNVNGEMIEYHDEEEDMRNPDYKPSATNLENYHAGDPEYDNHVVLNDYEKELSDYLQEVLMENSTVDKTQRYFSKGWAPRIAKSENDALTPVKELLKLLGGGDVSKSKNDWKEEVGYDSDFIVDPPMTHLLTDKRSTDHIKRQVEARKNISLADEMGFATDEEKNQYIAEQNAIIEDAKKHLQEINDSLLNRDWVSVVAEYLSQIGRYNAILDNKNKLYYVQNMLKNMNMLKRDPLTNQYVVDQHRGNKDNPVYVRTPDNQLIEQYENVIRRLVFDQWHERSALRATMDRLQTFTSANYMMLNVRGGIANVTLGISGILGEAAAKEALGPKDWAFGVSEWHKGVISYARRGFHIDRGEEPRCFSKQDAIIQYFDVVDYDEITGVIKETGIKEYSKKLRNMMFSPQTIGEHFMQNSVLFGMLHSHKLVTDDTGEVTFMSLSQYIQLKQQQGLEEILNEEQLAAFKAFKESIKSNEQKKKKYVEFRRNLLTDFIYLHCTKEQQEKFKKIRKEQADKARTEFEKLPNMYDQLELGDDGRLKFADGSMLQELDTKLYMGTAISKAERLCAEFAEKVRKTNNRIHGNYNRDGRAYIEKFWWGSLLMQYHKHLPMGILKRYLRKGHWDETRGTVMKGMWESFYDLLNLNFRKIRLEAGLTDDQVGALEAFSYTVMHIADYLKQLNSTIAIMPEYDLANLRRNVGDLIGVVSAMATVAALWYIADDDDDIQESIWFNLALYEADRLASEAFMYNPYGLFIEGKKLMSTPVAAQSIVQDALNVTTGIINWMTDDEYDPYYHSGRFAGKHKMQVWFERRIPMYNGIRSILDTPDANHYYKLGQNPIGLFNVKEWVTGDED